MGLSNTEKQRRHRQRLKHKGLVRIDAWTTPDRFEAIKRILQGLPTVFRGDADAVTGNQSEPLPTLRPEQVPGLPPEELQEREEQYVQPEPPEQQETAPEAPSAPAKPPSPPAASETRKPRLKKGSQEGEWRVFLNGKEVGIVTKQHYSRSGSMPAFNRWRASRPWSLLDALSDRTYRTREQAVESLLQSR